VQPIRRRRPLAEAGVLVVALLGLLGGPCAMAFAASADVDPPVDVLTGGHDNCPNDDSDRSMPEDGCCCLLNVAGGVGESKPKPAAPVLILALAVAPEIVVLDVRRAVALHPRSSLHQTSPPVYLATQRLRI
jgi:hypothetical protein